jgi:hypothetical protein
MNKFCFLFFVASALLLTACGNADVDSILGTWKADKVNVEFDESKSSPELVNQLGEIEKRNLLHFSDSVFSITNMSQTQQFQYRLDDAGVIYYFNPAKDLREEKFGVFKDNSIKTESTSVVGMIKITYVKEKDN